MLYVPDFSRVESDVEEPLIIHQHGPTAGTSLAVFLHGLNGSRYATWTPNGADPTTTGFPKFLYEDIKGLDVGLYSYSTGLQRLRFTRSIELDREATILTDLLRDSASVYPTIVLIGHSMGGLLGRAAIKELIERDDRRTLERIRGLFLLATPLAGSLRVPRFLWWLTADTRALHAHGRLVTDIQNVFTDRVVLDAKEAGPGQFALPTWVVAGAEDWWVDRLSSGLNVPRTRRKTIRGSHTSIVKPKNKTNDAYDWVLRRIKEIVEGVVTGTPETTAGRDLRETTARPPKTDLLRSPWLGIEFWQDDRRSPLLTGGSDVIRVPLRPAPFEMRIAAVRQDQDVAIAASYDPAIFQGLEPGKKLDDVPFLHGGSGMADTTYGSGELWIKDEAHMHLDWGGRLLPRPEGGGVVLFHSVYAPDVEPIGLPTGREVFTVVHVQTPDQRLLENPERFVLTFSST